MSFFIKITDKVVIFTWFCQSYLVSAMLVYWSCTPIWRRHTFLCNNWFCETVDIFASQYRSNSKFPGVVKFFLLFKQMCLILLRGERFAVILMSCGGTPTAKSHTFLAKDWALQKFISSQEKLVLSSKFVKLHSFTCSLQWYYFYFTKGFGNFSMT